MHEEQVQTLQKRKVDQLMQKIDMIVAGKKQKLLKQGLPGNKCNFFSLVAYHWLPFY